MHLPQIVRRALFAATILWVAMCFGLPSQCCAADEKSESKGRLKALMKERVTTAKEIYDLVLEKYNRGLGTIGGVHRAKLGLLYARLSLAETKNERVKLYEEVVKEAKDWEEMAFKNVDTGAGQRLEALTAKADRIEAELALECAKMEPEAIPPPKKER